MAPSISALNSELYAVSLPTYVSGSGRSHLRGNLSPSRGPDTISEDPSQMQYRISTSSTAAGACGYRSLANRRGNFIQSLSMLHHPHNHAVSYSGLCSV